MVSGPEKTLLRTKGSCFVDAVELAFGCPTDDVVTFYHALLPGSNPEESGFHPSVVNILLMEKFGTGLSEIDCLPVNEKGEVLDTERNCVKLISNWLNAPGFRCVLQGPKLSNGEEHAIAYRDGKFIDPSDMSQLETPTIQLRSVWVLAIPPRTNGGNSVPTESA